MWDGFRCARIQRIDAVTSQSRTNLRSVAPHTTVPSCLHPPPPATHRRAHTPLSAAIAAELLLVWAGWGGAGERGVG